MKLASFFLVAGLLCLPVRAAEPESILAGLRPEHPRLIITAAQWEELKRPHVDQPERDALVARIVLLVRGLQDKPLLVYKKEGKRLLAVSREALRRIVLCSFAYRITGEKAFLDRAEKEMLNVAAFKDWNPPHFLDTAEMTAAVALGYDWLYDGLTPETRAALRQAIAEKGINPGLAKNNWWHTGDNNWNQVCFGGLTLGSLAIAEDQPKLAAEFLALARKDNGNGLKPYAPDGIYPEGPGYWGYGTTYEVLMISALQSALGTDWGLPQYPGFLNSAAALVEQTGPTGMAFNFSDSHEGVDFNPTLYWFAKTLNQPSLISFQNELLSRKLASKTGNEGDLSALHALLALWMGGLPREIPPPTLPLAWHGDGPNPVGVFRSSWTDSNAVFLAFKGGSANVNHAHMDAGSFVLEADGVRWASDLGMQHYNSIESKGWALFNRTQNSDRWRVYRLNNFSHNTLTLGGKLHTVSGDARITAFTNNSATVNLSAIFAGQADRVIRQFSLDANRNVTLRDSITGAKPGLSVRWQMLTHAQINPGQQRAILTQNGKSLTAEIISPLGAHFEMASAQPPDDGVNQTNVNSRILVSTLEVPASGCLDIEVRLQPGSPTAVR